MNATTGFHCKQVNRLASAIGHRGDCRSEPRRTNFYYITVDYYVHNNNFVFVRHTHTHDLDNSRCFSRRPSKKKKINNGFRPSASTRPSIS